MALAISAIAVLVHVRSSRCERACARREWRAAVAACRDAYRDTGDAADGARLAEAHMYLDEMPLSEAVARELLTTSQRGTAHRILSVAERGRGATVAAAVHATTALAMHAQERADADVLRDAHALSGVWWQEGAFDAALAAAELARDVAVKIGDRRGQGFAELARADTFRMLGDDLPAERALEAATALLAPYCDRSWAHLKDGLLHISREQLSLGEIALVRALAAAEDCEQPAVADAVRLNLAWIARAGRRDREAERHLAAVVDTGVEGMILRALLAIDRGELGAASDLLARAAGESPPDADWPWLIAHGQAQVAEARGDDRRAEDEYRRALASVAALRSRAPDSAAYVIAAHRMPYEGLLALLARQGRWREALAVIVQLDASDMLRVTSGPGAIGPGGVVRGPGATADVVVRAAAGDLAAVDVDDVLEAWRGRDLVIVVATSPGVIAPRSERVWRLRVRNGAVTGDEVGVAWHAAALAGRLLALPADLEAAETLGAMIVPADDARGELHVLPVGVLGRVPLAALRRAGSLVIERRPILRVLGVRPRPHTPAVRREPAVVIGDPRGDLPSAAAEAAWVAARLGTIPWIEEQATWARLAMGAGADVLHVAAHTDERQRGIVLHLADRDVTPGDLLLGGVAPRLAVLSSCGSAAARDEGGWGSLAAALLAAGSDAVVATHWSIADTAAADLVRRFYDAGGRDAPARALATAQVALAKSSTGSEWAAFTVLAGPPSLRVH